MCATSQKGDAMTTKTKRLVAPGDLILTGTHRAGEGARSGKVLEVTGEQGKEHVRVRWEDGHESVLYSLEDVTVRPARR